MAEVPPSGEDHGEMVSIGDLDRHLVPDRSPRLDDRSHAGLRRDLDAVREREVGIRGHHREPRPLARAPEREQDAVGVGDLVERRRPLGAVAAARARVLRVALELADLERLVRTLRPEQVLQRMDAVREARDRIAANVNVLIALEAMTLRLRLDA